MILDTQLNGLVLGGSYPMNHTIYKQSMHIIFLHYNFYSIFYFVLFCFGFADNLCDLLSNSNYQLTDISGDAVSVHIGAKCLQCAGLPECHEPE